MKLRPNRHQVTDRTVRAAGLSPLAIAPEEETGDGEHLELPSPRSVLRRAYPVVLESVVVPVALFYVVLVTAGFRGIDRRTCLVLPRDGGRLRRSERISTMLLLGTLLLTVRTVVSFITGSALYFIQPTVMTAIVCLVLMGSALAGRPFTERFAAHFCPSDPSYSPDRGSAVSSSGSRSCGHRN